LTCHLQLTTKKRGKNEAHLVPSSEDGGRAFQHEFRGGLLARADRGPRETRRRASCPATSRAGEAALRWVPRILRTLPAPLVRSLFAAMSDCVAQGRLSVESVGRLVELERLASKMSPKPNFEGSLFGNAFSCPDADDAPVAINRSISDSLADAAFTMELGECDVDQDDDAASRPRRSSLYTESPYCYSFCPDNEEGARGRASDGSREMARAQQELATMQRSSSEHIISERSKKSDTDTYYTPTNIEDPLVNFGTGCEGGPAPGRQDSSNAAAKGDRTAAIQPAGLTAGLDLSTYYKQRRTPSMRRSFSDPSLVCNKKL